MSKLRKLNVSEVEGNENSVFPPGTVWINRDNSLRISDGQTEGGLPATSAADLGSFKIEGTTLGTKDNPDTGGWGGYNLGIDPGGESAAGIYIPGLAGQASGSALQIYNRGDASSPLQLFGRGGVQMVTGNAETEQVFEFSGNVLVLPPGGDIVDSNGQSVLGGGIQNLGNIILGNAAINVESAVAPAGTIISVPLNAAGDTIDYTGGASVIEIPTNPDTDQVQAGWIITFNGGVQRTVSGRTEAGGYTSIYFSDANPGGTLYPLTIQSADYVVEVTGKLFLIPDNNLYNNSQYIVVDPTAPNHIHLRAGGTIDSSAADLFLGGENNHVKVSDSAENIVIRTTTVAGEQFYNYDWTFSANGHLATPGEVTLGGQTYTHSAIIWQSGNGAVINNNNIDEYFIIATNTDFGTQHNWKFGYNGILSLPGNLKFDNNTVQTTAYQLVAPPAHSTGTSGDKAGMVAYDSSYYYYCTADFGGTIYTIASITSNATQSYLIMYSSNTGWTSADLTGFTVTGPGGYSGSVTGPSVLQGGTLYYIPVSPNVTQAMGDYVFTSGSNIWVRVAWTGTSW